MQYIVAPPLSIRFEPTLLARLRRRAAASGAAALDAAADVFAVDASRIATAMSYYASYRDEIDAEITAADEASAQAEEAWRVQQSLIS